MQCGIYITPTTWFCNCFTSWTFCREPQSGCYHDLFLSILNLNYQQMLDSNKPQSPQSPVPSPNVKISILPNSEINNVRKFLFRAYCIFDEWYPPLNDPAHFRVHEGNMLIDDRDFLSTHFVATNISDGEIVGCVRASFRLNGQFQVQLYDRVNDFSAYSAELSRFAVLPQYRGTDVGLQLMYALAVWCTSNRLLAFSAPAEKAISQYYKGLGWKQLDGYKKFRYFNDGDREAVVHGCKTLDEQALVVKRIGSVLKRLQGKSKL